MKQPALFLDRDGIIIFDSGYVREATNVTLIPGIVDLIRRAQAARFKILVVTNQSGLGRGWITLEQYQAVSDRMIELLGQQQVSLDGIYFSPFYEGTTSAPEALLNPTFQTRQVVQTGRWDLAWRKPSGGMLLQAAKDHQVDLKKSIMVGDRITDVVAGCLAGVAKTYLLTAATKESEAEMDEIPVWRSRLSGLSGNARKPEDLTPILIESLNEVFVL